MQLSIIIVSYNVKYFLEQCLCSVVKACVNIDAEIFVVDNNSTDNSQTYFTNRFSQVQFIWKKENAGFAKANNEALLLAAGEKILFLNPDTVVPENCFEKCLHFFGTAQSIGALGMRMIDGSGKYLPESKRNFPSPFTSFCKMVGLTKLFPYSKIFASYYLGHLADNKTNEVDVLAGACMMVNKKVLDQIGGFDERFFMYAEDIDLSYRIQKAGFKNYFFTGCCIIHFKGESTQKHKTGYVKMFYGAMALFVQKHYGIGRGRIFSMMLQAAIAVKALSTAITKLFEKTFLTENTKNSPSKLLVISDAATFEKIKSSLKEFEFQLAEKKIAFEIQKENNRAIVLTESAMSFKEMIENMEKHQTVNWFFIHASGTNSMVASNDKNNSGIVLPF